MQIILNDAHAESIEKALKTGLVDAVHATCHDVFVETTTGKSESEVFSELSSLGTELVVELKLSEDELKSCKAIVKKANELSNNCIVGVPATFEAIKAVRKLAKNGKRCSVNYVFTATQALMAAKAGAYFVSCDIDRMYHHSYDGYDLISNICDILSNYDFSHGNAESSEDSEVAFADRRKAKMWMPQLIISVKNLSQARRCAMLGVDGCFMPLNTFNEMFESEFTTEAWARTVYK